MRNLCIAVFRRKVAPIMPPPPSTPIVRNPHRKGARSLASRTPAAELINRRTWETVLMGAINAVATLAVEGEIGVLILNSPPVNALSHQLRTAIVEGMKQAIDDPAIKAVVLICEGKTFIAGADITE